MIHLFLHFLVPAAVALVFFKGNAKFAFLVMMATMLIDVDHLFADPIYDPKRCSIGFHPLHRLGFVALYIALCFFPKSRLLGLGLTIHMALDSIDCQLTNGVWWQSQ